MAESLSYILVLTETSDDENLHSNETHESGEESLMRTIYMDVQDNSIGR